MASAVVAAAQSRVAMVIPPYAMVMAPVADVRATTDGGAELVDQVHYHEMLRILAARGEWLYVQAEDHYFGWIRTRAVVPMPGQDQGHVVSRPIATVHVAADGTSDVVGQLPAGTRLPHGQKPPAPKGWVRLEDGYVSLDDATAFADVPHRYPTPDDLIATAEAFLGVPYLWGGTTALGMDCSGFVQQVYRLNGVRLDRDAHQQAVEGRRVDGPSRGDLIFFGARDVTHVGIAVDERSYLNAPESGTKVRLDALDGGRNVLAIRRYLP